MQCTIRSIRIPAWKVTLRLAILMYGYFGFCLLTFWWVFRPGRDFWANPQVLQRTLFVLILFAILLVLRWWLHNREQKKKWTAIEHEMRITVSANDTERIPIIEIRELHYRRRRKQLQLCRVGRLFPYTLARVNPDDAAIFQNCMTRLQQSATHNITADSTA